MSSASQPSYLEIAASSVQARQRIRNHIYQTPLIPARSTGKSTNATVLFKAENFQLTGSFKLRGAMAKMSASSSASKGGRLITASSGNHGIGTAFAARSLDKDLTVVLPESVVPSKLEKIKALELLEQCDKVDNIFISMGGGGLISGIGSVLKASSPHTKIWGIPASNSMALATSIHAGKVIETEHLDTLADAVAGGIDEDTITLSLATSVIDEFVECDEDAIVHALKALALEENMIVEGAATLALAGFEKVKERVDVETSVILLCGANYNQELILKAIYS
ncbi:hypothetical protein D6D05_07554 [Aureobasidium pullulans]|nr:hypothetical protein D6D05_07554 [Aureobasidium pullulans]